MRRRGLRSLQRAFASTRARILLIGALLLVPVGGVMVWQTTQDRLSFRERLVSEQTLAASAGLAEFERRVHDAETALSHLKGLVGLGVLDREKGCSDLLQSEMKEHGYLSNLLIVDDAGTALCSALPAPEGVTYRDRKWFRSAQSTGLFSVGEFVVGRISGAPTLLTGMPGTRPGGDRVYLHAGVSLTWIPEFFARQNLTEGTVVRVVEEASGLLMSRWPDPALWVGKSLSDDKSGLAARVPAVAEPLLSGEAVAQDGTPLFFAAAHRNGVSFRLTTPRSWLDQQVEQYLQRKLAVLVALGGSFTVLALLMTERVVLRPLRRIATLALARVTEISPARPVPQGDEFAVVDNAFQVYAEELEARVLIAERARDELASMEARRRAVFDSLHDGVVVASDGGKIIAANPSAATLLGRPERQLLESRLDEVLATRSYLCGVLDVRWDWEALLAKGAARATVDLRSAEGTLADLQLQFFPVVGLKDEVQSVGVVLHDSSAEHAVARDRELPLRIVAHELGTPIAAIVSLSERMATRDLPPVEVHENAKLIGEAAARTQRLVAQMLLQAQFEGGTYIPEFALLEVCEEASRAVRLMEGQFKRKALSLNWSCPRGPIYVECSQDAFQQVLLNLLDNACKYTPAGGAVLRVHADDEWVSIAVEDTGQGVSAEARDRIFSQWARGDNQAYARVPGLGLGLWLAKQLVETYGGTLTLETQQGPGATFVVCLPRVSVADD